MQSSQHSTTRWFLLVPSLTLLSALLPAQRTWRVPGDTATVNDAVRLASAGDRILLVSQQPYGWGNDAQGINVDKAVTIESLPGGFAGFLLGRTSPHAIKLTSMGGGHRFVLRNFHVVPNHSEADRDRHVCIEIALAPTESGTVILDGVSAAGIMSNIDDPCPGARISTGPGIKLMLRGCSFRGATGDVPWIAQGENGWRGSPGADIRAGGPAVIQDCSFHGGPGGPSWWWYLWAGPAMNGGPGLSFNGVAGALVGCTVIDGKGGDVWRGNYQGSANPCDYVGQPGVSSFPPDLFDVLHQPAERGSAGGCGQSPPPPRTLGTGRRDLRVASQHTSGARLDMSVRSLPVGQGWTVLIFGTDVQSSPFLAGILYPNRIFWVTVVSSSASNPWVTFGVDVPRLAEELDLVVQPAHLDVAQVQWRLGSPATFTIQP